MMIIDSGLLFWATCTSSGSKILLHSELNFVKSYYTLVNSYYTLCVLNTHNFRSCWWRIPQRGPGAEPLVSDQATYTERSPLKPNDYQLLGVERERQCLIYVM